MGGGGGGCPPKKNSTKKQCQTPDFFNERLGFLGFLSFFLIFFGFFLISWFLRILFLGISRENINNILLSKEGKLVNTEKSTKTSAKLVQKYE
jgi:hypothetical protein